MECDFGEIIRGIGFVIAFATVFNIDIFRVSSPYRLVNISPAANPHSCSPSIFARQYQWISRHKYLAQHKRAR